MTDVFSHKKRSEIMSHVRSKKTKPELIVRKFLFSRGFRYRLHDRRYPGSPDIILPKYRTIIFVNGCFWHGHESCRASRLPKSNTEFWTKKLDQNKKRDANVNEILEEIGFVVITIWECQIKNKVRRQATLENLVKEILSLKVPTS